MQYSIIIHGGAGTMQKEKFSAEKTDAYHEALKSALQAGGGVLKGGGTSLEAVLEAIVYLENHPFFNSGHGACFTYEGDHELDASIMDGKTGRSGSLAGVQRVKNPVKGALAVMQKTSHLILSGKKADNFAQEMGLETVDNEYFTTPERKQHWLDLKGSNKTDDAFRYGTVGAVAFDQEGHLACATSTGGITNKRYGRIGDTPLLGAGFYANDATCALSCTGSGEGFIRHVSSYDIHARMLYKQESLEQAMDHQIFHTKLNSPEYGGGIIGIDNRGKIHSLFNTLGMYRAYGYQDSTISTGIFEEEVEHSSKL